MPIAVYTASLQPRAHSEPFLIGVAGPSCAGKGELSCRLAAALGAAIVSLDYYYRDLAHLPMEERARNNFDVPAALDEELLAAHLRLLAEGREVEIPVYDFACHVRSREVHRVRPGAFIIVEGLFALYWEAVREVLDLKVFVDAADEVCLRRRIERDVRERGRTPDSVIGQYRTSVRPMARQYILPTRMFADLLIDGNGPLEDSVAQVLARIRSASAGDGPR